MEKSLIDIISSTLCFSPQFVAECAGQTASRRVFYKRAIIPKKRKPNAVRIVYLPSAEIKQIQHFLVECYLSKLPVHPAAQAYVKGGNVVKNAKRHQSNKHFLLLDIESFFDSLDADLFAEIVRKNRLFDSPLDIKALIALCTYESHFVQGCVSSPTIANAYLYDFDCEMARLAKTLPNGEYTRYSDDIVFSSTEMIPWEIVKLVSESLRKYKLTLNSEKTHFISNRQLIRITGIRLGEQSKIGLDTRFKKALKSEIYQLHKKIQKGEATFSEKNRVCGKLAYLKMVEPRYYNFLITKYCFGDISLPDYLSKAKFKAN